MSQTHPFKPIFDENSKILILGSFPSAPSRELGFYYANPQNRFWRVLAQI
ncbi:uracil-DNA glycosylase family protein, partial [uncultured Campylobacter sp.]